MTDRSVSVVALSVMLSACGLAESDPGPGGVTVGEARALDEAAEMLDEQSRIELPEDAAGEATVAGEGESEAAAATGE